ncbi:MAG: PQQ-binding-like beta-propeller repeat protein [Chitinophagaceae bacterium]|nr:PQQ-binding-like beta-propeller repeat protein [Oligoflexus sp.]
MALVNKTTGKDIWSFQSPGYIGIYAQCNEEARLYFTSQNKLYALNSADGKTLWSFDSGQPVDSGLNISCPPNYDSLYLSSFNVNGKFFSIEKATGKRRWDYSADGYVSFLGK